MKKVLLATAALAAQIASPAMAADWPVMAPTYEAAPPPPAVYSWWTGCYVGGNLGGAWSRAEYALDNTVAVERFTFTPLALIGGGQLGCQYQWNSWFLVWKAHIHGRTSDKTRKVHFFLIANAPSASIRSAPSLGSLATLGTAPCSTPRVAGLARD